MAKHLALLGYLNPDTFLELIQQPEQFSSQVVEQIPDHPDIKFRLEGYLFPETYELKSDADEREIIERMLKELERKLEQLPSDWRERMEERGLDLHQLLTIASLVEREVVLDEERPIVAGIIYNRLERGMMLQIDATVQYLFEEQKEIVEYRHLEIDDPYNTYQNFGLPPGPIASSPDSSRSKRHYIRKRPHISFMSPERTVQADIISQKRMRNISATSS